MSRSERVAPCRFPMTRCRAPRTRLSAPRYSAPALAVAEWRDRMYCDIDQARAQHAALKLIVERHMSDKGAARSDYRALRRVLELCRRAAESIDDRYCRDKLRLVEDFSAEMFSHGEGRAQFLKQQILNALELFHSRLYSLECLRRGAARASALKAAETLRT